LMAIWRAIWRTGLKRRSWIHFFKRQWICHLRVGMVYCCLTNFPFPLYY
jgi:hypothetical protein